MQGNREGDSETLVVHPALCTLYSVPTRLQDSNCAPRLARMTNGFCACVIVSCSTDELGTMAGVQVALVKHCIERGKLKNALQAAKALGLEAEFPDLERMQREDTLASLSKKQLWPQACHYVKDDRQLQASSLYACCDSAAVAQLFMLPHGLSGSTFAVFLSPLSFNVKEALYSCIAFPA